MRLEDAGSGMRVWLTNDESEQLTGQFEESLKDRLAIRLMLDGGLRTKEVLLAKPKDVREMDADSSGKKLRVWEGKGDKYRETYVPEDLAREIRLYANAREMDDDELVVDYSRHTLRRRVMHAAENLAETTGDDGWQHVRPHDCRRSWATQLVEKGVQPTIIMSLGGWDDWQTFRDHYLSKATDETVAREFEDKGVW